MAGGSGGFHIKVLRAIWEQYRRIADACVLVQAGSSGPPGTLRPAARDSPCRGLPPAPPLAEQQHRELVAAILLRHIWCVDKDPGALEVAKTNIWKEAVKLSPEDYNFRVLKAMPPKSSPTSN